MKFYIAAKFEEKEKVKKINKILRNLGHTVTCDWTLHKPIKPYAENPELSKAYADEEIEGIKNCDVFIQLSRKEGGTGMFVELGAAIILNSLYGKPLIYAVGKHNTRSTFYFHPSVLRRKKYFDRIQRIKG